MSYGNIITVSTAQLFYTVFRRGLEYSLESISGRLCFNKLGFASNFSCLRHTYFPGNIPKSREEPSKTPLFVYSWKSADSLNNINIFHSENENNFSSSLNRLTFVYFPTFVNDRQTFHILYFHVLKNVWQGRFTHACVRNWNRARHGWNDYLVTINLLKIEFLRWFVDVSFIVHEISLYRWDFVYSFIELISIFFILKIIELKNLIILFSFMFNIGKFYFTLQDSQNIARNM